MVAVAALFVLGRAFLKRTHDAGGSDFPAPLPVAADSGPIFEDFVAAEECAECHRVEYDLWRVSTHGNAGGAPSEVRVIAPFDGTPIQFKDAVVTPLTTEDGKRIFKVEQQGHPERIFEAAWVVGGGLMAGGGTQGFFTEYPDGTLRFLTFDFIRQEGVWFCQARGWTNERWTPITPDIPLAACSDWPPARVLGSLERYWNCLQCHGSQIEVSFDADAKRYRTRFQTLAINCDSCHGPGRRHVELARADSLGASADIGVEALATFDKDRSLNTCFQCHSVKEEIKPGYLPGKKLQAHFGLKLPLLSNRPLFPDGRIRLFAYQAQHLFSDCYLNGSMTCVDCHDPHSQKYRDVWGEPLRGRFDDGQCLGCHPAKADSLERHTYHEVDSPGSRCVACHMPYLQEPDVGQRLRYSRSDHTIPIPRLGLDRIFGIENACMKCHSDYSFDAMRDTLLEWYGTLKPLKGLVEGVIRAQRAPSRLEAARLELSPGDGYEVLEYTGLAYFFLIQLSPDMPALEAEIVERLKQLTESDDVDIQALALTSLHLARGKDPEIRSFLSKKLGTLGTRGPRDEEIRRRWVWILNFRAEIFRLRGNHREALAIYEKAQEILPGDPMVLRNLGIAYSSLGAYGKAIASLRGSLEVDPVQPLTLVNLAFALTQQGDFSSGLEVYRQAIEMNPYEPNSYLSLGNALLRQGMVEPAVDALERAVALDPSFTEAQFTLGLAYVEQHSYDEALAALNRGLEFDPTGAGAQPLIDALRRQGVRASP